QSAQSQAELTQLRLSVTHGIVLDLTEEPAPIAHANTHLVTQHLSMVRDRLAEYIELGAVVQLPVTDPPPALVQPLHVIVKAGKKPRLVIDLSRNLNAFIDAPTFQMETVRFAVQRSKQRWRCCKHSHTVRMFPT